MLKAETDARKRKARLSLNDRITSCESNRRNISTYKFLLQDVTRKQGKKKMRKPSDFRVQSADYLTECRRQKLETLGLESHEIRTSVTDLSNNENAAPSPETETGPSIRDVYTYITPDVPSYVSELYNKS
ncbi:hypothetical protein ALC53_04319 [Atta colombica]|uniref:Uncharacterized protein n=1 Tax=Atta colombica TaxID=520822 RepID=A0A151I534_9HYME|nr:hypothetical protein ALC53_04319 [Atta colombica]